MSTPPTQRRSVMMVLGAIAGVQIGGALAAALVADLGPFITGVMRLAFAALVVGVLARPRLRGYSRTAWGMVIAYGAALCFMNLAFYASLAYLPLGIAVTAEFVGPLGLAAATSRAPRDIVAVVAAGAGVWLIADPLGESGVSLIGLSLALTAGLGWAVYIVTSKAAGAEFPNFDALAIGMAVALVFALPTLSFGVPSISLGQLGLGLAIALLSSVIPYGLELMALRTLAPNVFGVLLSLEPAAAALAGWLILGQQLPLMGLVGMGLVVLGSIVILGSTGRRVPEA